MPTTNADRLKRYKQRMKANGFIRLNIWAHLELQELLVKERQGGECYGRTIERLLLEKRYKRHGDRWFQFRDLPLGGNTDPAQNQPPTHLFPKFVRK